MEPTAAASLAAIWTALNHGDVDEALAYYDDEATILLAGAPAVTGQRAIRDWWQAQLAAVAYNMTPEVTEEVDVGDGVVLRGTVSGTVTPRSGDGGQAIDLWFLQVYRRGEDQVPRFWRGASGAQP